MFRSNLKVIIRQIKNIYAFLNIAGLSIALTVFILIFFWVKDEISYDRFHTDQMDIYRVLCHLPGENGESVATSTSVAPLAEYLKNNFGEVKEACKLRLAEYFLKYGDTGFYKKGIVADPAFFSMFNFPLKQGDLKSFTEGVDKIIISQQVADIYFHNDNALNKTFVIGGRDVLVVGVLENIPTNSHLQFDFVIPINFIKELGLDPLDSWGYYSIFTYIKINGSDPNAFTAKIKDVIKKNDAESPTTLSLQPLAAIHLHSANINGDMEGHGNILYVHIFSSIAIFILLMASINYSNLATARSMKRGKETGVRKMMGSNRTQLTLYFFSESILYCSLALLVALLCSWLVLPSVNELTGKTLAFDIWSLDTIGPILVFMVLCAILGGAYPAFMLASQSPVVAFKGMAKAGPRAILLRRSLVVLQFTVSIGVLVGMLVIQRQLDFIQSKELGYDKENIITFTMIRKVRANYSTIKSELLALPGVNSVTAANQNMSLNDAWTDELVWEGKNPGDKRQFSVFVVDHDFLKTYSIQVATGRDFSNQTASDSTAIILNEEAVKQMGIKDPINLPVKFHGVNHTVIGVVKDFHFKSIHKKIEPLIIHIDPSMLFQITIKFNKGDFADQVRAAEAVFKKFTPDRPFDYTVLTDDIENRYKTENRVGKVFTYFAALAIFVSGLGLLGIILFVTEQRAKELAVRKVLGAPVLNLMWMLTREYLIMACIGFCLVAPFMYYAMDKWLAGFAYRSEVSFSSFLLAALTMISLAWLTVALRSFQAATNNPVESLRSE